LSSESCLCSRCHLAPAAPVLVVVPTASRRQPTTTTTRTMIKEEPAAAVVLLQSRSRAKMPFEFTQRPEHINRECDWYFECW
jgi:hypothetical protein